MPYRNLKSTDIDELIRMVGVINEKANSDIVPILKKLRSNQSVQLTSDEEDNLEKWSKNIEDLEKADSYKAAKPLVWIVKKWSGR